MATLQIRNFPDELKDHLRERSAGADLTMSDYVITLVRRDLMEPTIDDWLARAAAEPARPDLNLTGARAVEEARTERDGG